MLKKFCEVSSCSGVVDLYEARNNKCHFIFWAVIMACMMCASVYFTYATIKGYVSTPSVTNVATVSEKHLDMPEVLICYNGGMNISAMIAANFSKNLVRVFGSPRLGIEPTVATNAELMWYTKSNNLTMKDLRQHFSYTCAEMVEFFAVPGKQDPIMNGSRCDLAVPLYTASGVCYLYKNNSQQNYPGNGGLEISLKRLPFDIQNVFLRREMPKHKISNDFSLSMEQAFGKQISQRSVSIPMNSIVTIALNTKRYVRLPTTRQCDSRPEIYTSNTCYQNCYLNETIKTCKCQTIFFSNFEMYPNVDLCDPLTEWNCQLDQDCMDKCEESCLAKCDEWIFEYTISTSTYDEDVDENSTTHISIQYNTMQYTKIEEVEAFTMDMAVANVGGQSGLWLGASFVTIIQAIYYLVLAAFKKIGSRENEISKIIKSKK